MSRAGLLMLVGASVACAGGAGAAPGRAALSPSAPVSYTAGRVTYYVAVHGRYEQEVGGQSQQVGSVLRYQLTIVLEPAGLGFAARVVVDTVLQAQGQSLTDPEAAGRAALTAVVSADGSVADLSGADATGVLGQIVNGLRFIYPRLPAGGLIPGGEWVDTSSATVSGPADLDVTTITQYRGGAWTEFAGRAAIAVVGTGTYDVIGAGEQAGQRFEITGIGVNRGTSYLGADGRFLGAVSTDTVYLDILLAGRGVTIPVRQIQFDTVRAIMPDEQ
ncbi:MAG TPA: hypothetical protein VGA37_14840 [Gemmatimonadales bacterium]